MFEEDLSHRLMSRRQAREWGSVRYYTAIPCKYGHDCERYVSSGACVNCNADSQVIVRKAFKERYGRLVKSSP